MFVRSVMLTADKHVFKGAFAKEPKLLQDMAESFGLPHVPLGVQEALEATPESNVGKETKNVTPVQKLRDKIKAKKEEARKAREEKELIETRTKTYVDVPEMQLDNDCRKRLLEESQGKLAELDSEHRLMFKKIRKEEKERKKEMKELGQASDNEPDY
eukprot:Trichotokara_eunicae@DN3841_c0_g1_i1.p1